MSALSGSCCDTQAPIHRESIPSHRNFNATAGRSKSSPSPDAEPGLCDDDENDDDSTTHGYPHEPRASPFASDPQGLSNALPCLALPVQATRTRGQSRPLGGFLRGDWFIFRACVCYSSVDRVSYPPCRPPQAGLGSLFDANIRTPRGLSPYIGALRACFWEHSTCSMTVWLECESLRKPTARPLLLFSHDALVITRRWIFLPRVADGYLQHIRGG